MILRPLACIAFTITTLVPCVANADATGPCHCYRDRTFDPERPGAADAYILATTRSSLLSAAFGRSKRELVQAVMTGTAPDDLWIADWAAARTGRSSPALLAAKGAAQSWKAVLVSVAGLSRPFADAMARGSSDAELAALVVDDVLVSRMRTEAASVAALRKAGASTSELILAAVLAARLHTNASTVLEPVRAGKATWGIVLQGLGLTPKDIDGVVRQLIAR
jgi:hypothetical protein